MQTIFRFKPIYKERPWGGRRISGVSPHHHLPDGKVIGESWEISDRQGDESEVEEGEFKGKSIRWLLDQHGTEIMGQPWEKGRAFPLLIKILDAMERMSLQVHPPAKLADKLGGEPKTEMWFLLDAQPQAGVLAGLKEGVSRPDFETALKTLQLEPLVHRIPVQKGDSMFIPSGRLHAIDAGCLILEIQQNSDTTYRVYDWGRVGLDGKPRELHVEKSMQSIDFNDFEPSVIHSDDSKPETLLADCDYFTARRYSGGSEVRVPAKASILFSLSGKIEISSSKQDPVQTEAGRSFLLSAVDHRIKPLGSASFVLVTCKG